MATVLADSAMVHTDQAPKGPSRGSMWPHVAITSLLVRWKKQILLSTVKGEKTVPAPGLSQGLMDKSLPGIGEGI